MFKMILGLTLLIISLTLLLFTWHSKQASLKNLPPGPSSLALITGLVYGVLYKIPPYKQYQAFSRIHGPIIHVALGALPFVIITDYALAKEALSSPIWVDRLTHPVMEEMNFGKRLGVFMISGSPERWKEIRRFTIRTLREFGFGKQISMEVSLQEEAQDLVDSLLQKVKTGNGVIEMKRFSNIPMVNILWRMFAGTRFAHDDKRQHQLVLLIDKLFKQSKIGGLDPVALRMAFPILDKIPFLFAEDKRVRMEYSSKFQEFLRESLEERRALGNYHHEQNDFVDVFLQKIDACREIPDKVNLYTDEQFISIGMDLFTAGADTTSSTTEFVFLYLSLYPDVQAKLRAEIDSVIGPNRLPSLENMTRMRYMEAVLMEVHRVVTIVPLIMRSPCQATTLGTYFIPEGTVGLINSYAIHRDRKLWEMPDKFMPERFLDSQNNIINAEKLLSFGVGPRSCIGQVFAKSSLFVFITTLLQRFTFEPSPNHPSPSKEPDTGLTQAAKPFHLLLKERKF